MIFNKTFFKNSYTSDFNISKTNLQELKYYTLFLISKITFFKKVVNTYLTSSITSLSQILSENLKNI